MQPIHPTYLDALDVEALDLSDAEIIAAIETGLAAQGRGESVIEPLVHLEPGAANSHFNALRGAFRGGFAGVKVIGDFVDNYRQDLPPRWACSSSWTLRTACRARSWTGRT